jgi:PIN domain nuclease of toxin-antitoxin system
MTLTPRSPTTSSPRSKSRSSLLLDTHVFLWWCQDSRSLSQGARADIAAADAVYVSVASAWETAIKISLGKLRLEMPFAFGIQASGFTTLPITLEHAERMADLPVHHRDPFDRLLIAQAQIEGLSIATHDDRFQPYAVDVAWV